jgi:transcriptional regulator with XRE-family HTH domain
MTDSQTPLFQHVGLAIKIFREHAGLSQAAVATQAGIGKSQLSKYESGKEYPKLDSLGRVLIVLGVTPFSFFHVTDFLDRAKKGVTSIDQLGGFWVQLGPPALGSAEDAFGCLMRSLFTFIQAKADGRLTRLAAAPSKEGGGNHGQGPKNGEET